MLLMPEQNKSRYVDTGKKQKLHIIDYRTQQKPCLPEQNKNLCCLCQNKIKTVLLCRNKTKAILLMLEENKSHIVNLGRKHVDA